MTKMLSRAGFACETAHNGSEAVDKVRGKHANRAVYDVILMDFFMPEMNGPDAVKEIRALGYQGTVLGTATATAFPARLCVDSPAPCRLTRHCLPFPPHLPPFRARA
jgi:CheY-like chemotaxis protein